jgi:predicted MFS family arabinose efflux permease
MGQSPRPASQLRPGGLLWHQDFRRLWIGESTSKLGSSMTAMAMPLVAVVMLNANTLMIGLLQAAVWLPWLLLGLPAGAWIDRFTPRPVMLICNIASLALFASVPLAAWTGLLTIGQLLIVALLSGIAGVFFSTAYQPYLTSLLPRKDLAEANAKLQGSESAAYIVGPGLGGVIAQVFGAVSALLVDALTFAVSALCLARIRVREPARAPQPKRRRALRTEIADGIRFIVRDPYLRAITLYGGATNFAGNIMHAVLVVFLVRSVGISPGSTGGLLALAGLGGVVGAMLSSRLARRLGTARAVLVGEACTAPFGLLIPLTTPGPGLAFSMVGGTVLTAGVVAGNVITASFRQSYILVAMLGRVTATTRLVIFGGIPVGALLGGILGDLLGPRGAIWVSAVATVLCVGILFTGPIRRRRDFPESLATAD